MRGFMLAVVIVAGVPQIPAPNPDAPPIIDIALRMVRAGSGGSSIARSGVRGDQHSFLYAGLDPCIIGAGGDDPARENSVTWRASGRLRSFERGIAVADVEWQRLEYRPAGVVASPRVRTTLTMPLGERVAVDFVDAAGSPCRMDALIFEIGVAADNGFRLSMSAEGRSETSTSGVSGGGRGGVAGGGGRGAVAGSGGRGGAGIGPPPDAAQSERQRQGEEAARAASVVTRPMPPRQYDVDVWLVPEASSASVPPPLAQRMSQVIGGTGGRFTFPSISVEAGDRSVVVELSALVIPVAGEQLILAITRRVTPSSGASSVSSGASSGVSSGWIKAVPLPKADAVLSFEIPGASSSEAAIVPRQGYGLRVRIGPR